MSVAAWNEAVQEELLRPLEARCCAAQVTRETHININSVERSSFMFWKVNWQTINFVLHCNPGHVFAEKLHQQIHAQYTTASFCAACPWHIRNKRSGATYSEPVLISGKGNCCSQLITTTLLSVCSNNLSRYGLEVGTLKLLLPALQWFHPTLDRQTVSLSGCDAFTSIGIPEKLEIGWGGLRLPATLRVLSSSWQ